MWWNLSKHVVALCTVGLAAIRFFPCFRTVSTPPSKTLRRADVALKTVAGIALLARLASLDTEPTSALWLATAAAIAGDLVLATHEDADGRSMTLGTFCFDVSHTLRAIDIAPLVAAPMYRVSVLPRFACFAAAYKLRKPAPAFAFYAADMLGLLCISFMHGTHHDIWAAMFFCLADLGVLCDVWGWTLPRKVEHGVWALPLYYAGHWLSTAPLFAPPYPHVPVCPAR